MRQYFRFICLSATFTRTILCVLFRQATDLIAKSHDNYTHVVKRELTYAGRTRSVDQIEKILQKIFVRGEFHIQFNTIT